VPMREGGSHALVSMLQSPHEPSKTIPHPHHPHPSGKLLPRPEKDNHYLAQLGQCCRWDLSGNVKSGAGAECCIEAKSLDVDVVSGAAAGSKAILKAIENALAAN